MVVGMDFTGNTKTEESQDHCCNLASVSNALLDSAESSSFKDRFVLGKQLGLGQFGVIRECSDKCTGEVLACKSIAKDRLVTPGDVQTLKLEIEIMGRLSSHPNVVNLKAVYEEDNYVHLVMELCAGGELFHQLEKLGRFSEPDAWFIFKHLMQVVQYCHDNGIVHRDLKPENILLATKSSSSQIKLADFGLATYIKPGEYLQGTVGSPFYIAPEVLAGGYNQAADVWSAGVILYILLSGMPPFWGNSKSEIFNAVRAAELRFLPDPWDGISMSAKALVMGMLCVDPSKRLNAAEVLAHSWMQDCLPLPHISSHNERCERPDSEGSSPFYYKDEDNSFYFLSPLTIECQAQQPSLFTSFSSFLADSPNPSSSLPFSSTCPGESNAVSMPSTLSFAFYGASSEQQSPTAIDLTAFVPDLIGCHEKAASTRKDNGHPNESLNEHCQRETSRTTNPIKEGSKLVGIPSRRNHTIGLGELDQLKVVAESIIRWASCTHISSAQPLGFSCAVSCNY